MKILDKYYAWVGNSDFVQLLTKKNLTIDWLIEAGCHDGQDTLNFSQNLNPSRIFAFEPDPQARAYANKLFEDNGLEVELYACGLSNKRDLLFMNFLNGELGTGSTFLGNSGSMPIEVFPLNSFDFENTYGGALWLDVEGHALQVLQGATKYLPLLKAAKVEVQMHIMHKDRLVDAFEINQLMRKYGLYPVKAPVHPGYFGDIIYLNRREIGYVFLLWSILLEFQLYLLHKVVYPLLRKPS